MAQLRGFATITRQLEGPSSLPQRGLAKTANPNIVRRMVLLDKDTKKKAERKFEDEFPKRDLSDLVEALLSAYQRGQIVVHPDMRVTACADEQPSREA